MNYQLEFTRQYLKDLKRARKRGLEEEKLNKIILQLIKGEELSASNRDHALTGDYKGYRECHISPNWLLVYRRDKTLQIVTLVRTGTHADLF